MVLDETVPGAMRALRDSGVVLEFVFFADIDGTETPARDAVGAAVERACAGWPARPDGTPRGIVNRAHLHHLPCSVLTREAFLGDWVDSCSGTRLWDRDHIRSKGFSIPELWSGGQFGYAFAQPPYALEVSAARVQELFDGVCDLVLPAGTTCVIRD